MFKPKTYLDLCFAMRTRADVQINSIVGVINGISVEDGSGNNFIIAMRVKSDKHGGQSVNENTFVHVES